MHREVDGMYFYCTCTVTVICRNLTSLVTIKFAQLHFRTKYLMGHHISKSTVDYYGSYEGRSTVYDWMLSFETISKETNYFPALSISCSFQSMRLKISIWHRTYLLNVRVN
jgi:hypothetical protein